MSLFFLFFSFLFAMPLCDEFPSAKYFRIFRPRRCNLNNITHLAVSRIRIMSMVISHLTWWSREKIFLLNNKSAIIHDSQHYYEPNYNGNYYRHSSSTDSDTVRTAKGKMINWLNFGQNSC